MRGRTPAGQCPQTDGDVTIAQQSMLKSADHNGWSLAAYVPVMAISGPAEAQAMYMILTAYPETKSYQFAQAI